MRFITEFETDDSSYVKGIKKIHGEENIGHEIAISFGWNERKVTKLDPDVRVIHIHKLEIEAFPMEKWIEFKQKLFDQLHEGIIPSPARNEIKISKLIKELESFGKPAGDTITNLSDQMQYRGSNSDCKACEDEANGIKHLMAQKHTCRK